MGSFPSSAEGSEELVSSGGNEVVGLWLDFKKVH